MDIYDPIRNLSFNQIQSYGPATNSGPDDPWVSQNVWTTDFDALTPYGFQSKYNYVRDLGNNQIQVTFQNPGRHKYETLEAVYEIDPATGQARMVGDPWGSHQISSMQDLVHDPVDALTKMVGSAAALYGAAQLGAYALGGESTLGTIPAANTAGMTPITSSVPSMVAPEIAAGAAGTGGGVAIGGGAGGAAAGGAGAAIGGGTAGGTGVAGAAMAPGSITSTVPAATVSGMTTAPAATSAAVINPASSSLAWRVGGSLAGNVLAGAMQGSAAQRAAAAQMAAAQGGQASLEGVYERIAQLMQPYVGAGVSALDAQQALIGLKGPEAQKAAIAALESSPEFGSMVRQGEEAILANASATGGLRGGNTQAALAKFRPAVLSELINQQYGRLSGLSVQGQNAAAGVGNAGVSIGGGIANLMQQGGAAQAGAALARGQTNAGYVSAIGNAIGLYYGLKGG